MKKFLVFLLILTVRHTVLAQDRKLEVIGHHRNEIFVLAANGYYLVERLSPLKYNSIIYDTLFQTTNGSDSFGGRTYTLLLKQEKLLILNSSIRASNGKKRKKIGFRLQPVDSIAISNRNRKHNHFYYRPYGLKIAQYSRLLREKDKDEYMKFDQDRTEMYEKTEELSIEDFRQYFHAFLKKYNLEDPIRKY